jgi:hypothetical protein
MSATPAVLRIPPDRSGLVANEHTDLGKAGLTEELAIRICVELGAGSVALVGRWMVFDPSGKPAADRPRPALHCDCREKPPAKPARATEIQASILRIVTLAPPLQSGGRRTVKGGMPGLRRGVVSAITAVVSLVAAQLVAR